MFVITLEISNEYTHVPPPYSPTRPLDITLPHHEDIGDEDVIEAAMTPPWRQYKYQTRPEAMQASLYIGAQWALQQHALDGRRPGREPNGYWQTDGREGIAMGARNMDLGACTPIGDGEESGCCQQVEGWMGY